jgi:hypothetical protein
MRDDNIENIFGARNEMPLYQNIEDNQFFPLLISERAALQFSQLAEDKGIPNVFTDEILEVIEQMSLDMSELKLNQDFTLDIENYLLPTPGDEASLITPPLPIQVTDAKPNSQIINSGQTAQLNNGLTMSENALLSEEEKMIRLRQRNMIT